MDLENFECPYQPTMCVAAHKIITELEYKNTVLLRLLKLVYRSDRAVKDSPLYNLNPSWRTMQSIEAALNGEEAHLIKEHLAKNDLWEDKNDKVL